MKLSVTTDMFNYILATPMQEKLALFKRHGFDYLHWCDNWNDDVVYSVEEMKRFKKMIEDADLKCLDVHGTATHKYSIDAIDHEGRNGFIKLLENRVRFCHELGGDAVVVHPPVVYGPNLEKRVHVSKKSLEVVRITCFDLGVTLAIENCHKDDHHTLEDYFTKYNPEFIGFCYDSGHANIHGNFEYIKKFGDRLKVTHLHDNDGAVDFHKYPGWGTIDWAEVSNWLKSLDYRKPWNFEVTHGNPETDGTAKEFLTKTVSSTRLL